MKTKNNAIEAAVALEQMAMNESDVPLMSTAMRSQWEVARRRGEKGQARPTA